MTSVSYYSTTHLEKPVGSHKHSLLGVTGSGMRKHVDYCIDLYFTRKYKVCTLSDLDQNKER